MLEDDQNQITTDGPKESAEVILARLRGKDRKLTEAMERIREMEAALGESAAQRSAADSELQARLDEAERRLAEYETARGAEELYASMPEASEIVKKRLGRDLTASDRALVEGANAALEEIPTMNLADRPRRTAPPEDSIATPAWPRQRLEEAVNSGWALLQGAERSPR